MSIRFFHQSPEGPSTRRGRRAVNMERIPEPEIMDDEEGAVAYAGADFSESNQLFVDRLAGAGCA